MILVNAATQIQTRVSGVNFGNAMAAFRLRVNRSSRDSSGVSGISTVLPPSNTSSLRAHFDSNWYLQRYSDVADAGIDCFEHYVSDGWREGRWPNANFDPAFYTRMYLADIECHNPFEHYICFGVALGYAGSKSAYDLRCVAAHVDEAYYFAHYSEAAESGLSAADHYIKCGALIGFNPSAVFDTDFYLRANPDVREEGINPLLHYIEFGEKEGRAWSPVIPHNIDDGPGCFHEPSMLTLVENKSCISNEEHNRPVMPVLPLVEAETDDGSRYAFKNHPLFNAQWYWARYQQGTASDEMPAHVHYHSIGHAVGHWPHPLFDPYFYRRGCIAAGITPNGNLIDHYNNCGAFHHISPHRLFDPEWYASELTAVGRPPGDSSLTDYLVHGDPAGLSPHALFCVKQYRPYRETEVACLVDYVLGGWKRRIIPSPLFDVTWYLKTYRAADDAFIKGIDPLSHYLLEGGQRGYATHPAIDPAWYDQLFVTGTGWDRTTTEHIQTFAPRPVARLSPNFVYDFARREAHEHRQNHAEGVSPLVSIIIINMNGEAYLEALFTSLAEQTYTNFEVVFVDNNSTDSSRDFLSILWPDATHIALDRNAGFAEANNIGLQASRGELIALLNNDTRVDTNWLSELVASLNRHPQAGAVTSRVRFWSKFRVITVHSTEPFKLDHSRLLLSLDYAKILVKRGELIDGSIASTADPIQKNHVVEVKLPSGEERAVLRVTGGGNCRIHAPLREKIEFDEEGIGTLTLNLSSLGPLNSFFVINNAGSHEPFRLATADTGFGEIDLGQYGIEREVPLACGCAMIVRRAALGGMMLFPSDFIAYFEDSELSRRLRRTGHTIVYSPGAIVYHRHSSTSTERSAFWYKQVRRNSVLYRYMETPERERHAFLRAQMMELNHYSNWLVERGDQRSHEENVVCEVLPDVIAELKPLCAKVDAGKMVERAVATRIGLYNLYWSSLGGGEAHALFVASYLARFDIVELIADLDFDMDFLGSYYGVDVSRFRKRIIPTTITSVITSEYDVFVNSTYMDETPSWAKHSFYIVSFPSKAPSQQFLHSYMFLTNSPYTHRWAERYWGDGLRMAMLEPVVADTLVAAPVEKQKVLLSVGRFFADGHSKNQLQIVRAFKAADLDGWTLKLAGSIGSQNYYDAVEAEAEGSAIELHPNASLDNLRQLYAEAAVYVHASGLGRDQEEEPENFEHFGMTVAEACANGCYPVVFNCAGPADIIKSIENGIAFHDEVSLLQALKRASRVVSADPQTANRLRDSAAIYTGACRQTDLEKVFATAFTSD